jgi:hypothetical protein
MHLIQLLLPLYDTERQAFGKSMFDRVRDELTETFGGVTAYRRSPAEGAWKEGDDGINRDAVVIYEVMAKELDRAWWKRYGEELASRFRQEEMMIRAIAVERL